MEFHLEKQWAKLAHINLREEKHGDEAVLAVDLKFEASVHNDFLSYLSPTLKWSLYDKEVDQAELPLDDANHLPRLRYPQMGEICWDGKMVDAEVIVHGLKPEYDMALTTNVHKLKLDPTDGGSVAITFSATLKPNPGQSAALVVYLGKDVRLSVRPADGAELSK